MSGKVKSRNAANADGIAGGVSCDERILRDIHQLYMDSESGELNGWYTLWKYSLSLKFYLLNYMLAC